MPSRKGRPPLYVALPVLMGIVGASVSAVEIGDINQEQLLDLWKTESMSAADLRDAGNPANEWIVKLKTSFTGVMGVVCEWEKMDAESKKSSSLLSAVAGSASMQRSSNMREVETFVKDYEEFRTASGDQICSHSKQMLNALDVMTVSTTNTSALKDFQNRMGDFVSYVEPNQPVRALQVDSGLWGLDRIDQPDLPMDNSFTPDGNGAGVHVYIIDTGINSAHTEFAGRIGNGHDFVSNDNNPEDCNGHGTHCAGTALGSTYGIARAATLHGVRVLSCSGSGSYTGVIAGMNWVAENHISPAVASMSLGGGRSQAINDAVSVLHNAGVVVTTAAGNSNADACGHSPASAPMSFTVASTTSSDARSSFSNWGECVNIFAPGSSIKSAWIGSATATRTISGTSMATPHVAGVMALYLGANPDADPLAVWQGLEQMAVTNRISDPRPATPNLLLQAVGFCDRDQVPGPHEDCVLSEWSPWSSCSSDPEVCDEGARARTRTVLVNATGCGSCSTLLEQSEPCFAPGCTNPEPAQLYSGRRLPVSNTSITFAPDPVRDPAAMEVVCQEDIAAFPPVDTAAHSRLTLSDDHFLPVDFPPGRHFTFFGEVYQRMYVGSNGYVTFGQGDSSYHPVNRFFVEDIKRVGALMTDLNPQSGGTVTAGFEEDRAVVTWTNVRYYGSRRAVNLQVELVFGTDQVRISYGDLQVRDGWKMTGVGAGRGVPGMWSPEYELLDSDTPTCVAPEPEPPAPPRFGEEVARLKPAHQSSTSWGGVASRGNDGDTNQEYFANSCTHTEGETSPFWTVDLLEPKNVSYLKIWNRADCCGERLRHFEIRVGDSENFWAHPRCSDRQWSIPNGEVAELDCDGLVGRYVTVVIPGQQNILTLCEVKVFATNVSEPAPPPDPTPDPDPAPPPDPTPEPSLRELMLNWLEEGMEMFGTDNDGAAAEASEEPAAHPSARPARKLLGYFY